MYLCGQKRIPKSCVTVYLTICAGIHSFLKNRSFCEQLERNLKTNMTNMENNPGNFCKGKWIWFRINGDSEDQLQTYFNDLATSNKFDYIYAQFEHTSEHGLHLQGMCYSMQQITSNQFKNILYPVIPAFGGLKSKNEVKEMDRHIKRQETRCSDLEPPNNNSLKAL